MAAGLWYENGNQICGRVAQLDRALASEAKGRGFKSRLVHHRHTTVAVCCTACITILGFKRFRE